MIETINLTKRFGETLAVSDLSFEINDGEIFGLLGPNGAGKTTAMRMLCCLIAPTGGSAKVSGYNIIKEPDSLKIRRMVGLVPGDVGLYEDLSVYENLNIFGRLYETPPELRQKNIKYYLNMFDLWTVKDQLAGNLSKGMKQKAALARALIHNPNLLFLDEPTANLDPETAKMVRDLLLKMKSEGKTIFLNTHNLAEAQKVCDRIGILKTKLLVVNTPDQLEQAIGGQRSVFELELVNDSIATAVRKLGLGTVSISANKIIVTAADPPKDNPKIVQAIIAAGGRIRYVTEEKPDLEAAYLKIIGENK